ncbi:NRDE family protein [Methylocaldum sp.]|uniref:NRDE family protein n=1 Tax=Methylocaldum sp. TaxID=1969727 RepID=UPI002D335785|nr:NRDE family protein [Methylocaldum sp.]HYE35553.1 NRDE family protein [Methylocaldum sp.]
MSVIALAWGAHPDFPLVLIANRDEQHARPTAPAAWWPTEPAYLGARDLARGGTWFGVARDGRFALVTSFRDGSPTDPAAPTRGQLPLDYLTADEEPVVHARRFARARGGHPPFNLLLGSPRHVFYAATRARLPLALTPGIHTLSNGLVDEPWPKCVRLDTLLGSYLKTHGGFAMLLGAYSDLSKASVRGADDPACAVKPVSPADFATAGFAMLADRETTSQGLPDTGVGAAEEERLSACFVVGPESGTRSSTALVMARDGSVYFEERSFDLAGTESSRVVEEWTLDPKVFSAGGIDD